MNKVLVATAALVISASSVAAFDITPSLSVDNEVKTWYNTSQSTWTATYEIKPTFSPSALPGMSVYVMNDGDLRNIEYDGLEFGVQYQMGTSVVSPLLTAKVEYNEDWKRGDIMVGAQFNF